MTLKRPWSYCTEYTMNALSRFIPYEYSLQLIHVYSLHSTLLTTAVPPYLSAVSIYLSASSADAAVVCPEDSLLGAKCTHSITRIAGTVWAEYSHSTTSCTICRHFRASCQTPHTSRFFLARRCASADVRYGPLSVTRPYCIKTTEHIELCLAHRFP